MANLEIKNPPEFTTEVPKVGTEDFITADLENEIKGKLLNNTVFLKAIAEEVIKHMKDSEIHVTAENKQSWDNKAETSTATQSENGLMSKTDKGKLDGIAEHAEVNQNAISSVNAGGIIVESNDKTAQIAILSGSNNVTVTGDNATKQVKISVSGGNADTLGNHSPQEVVRLGGKHLAGQGEGGGYSFSGDGAEDTGMFSDSDGDLYFKQNGAKWYAAHADHTHDYIPTNATCNKNWNWSGQGGQPDWVWGGFDGTNMYVYSPSNFSVNHARSAGNAIQLDGHGQAEFSKATNVGNGRGGFSIVAGYKTQATGFCSCAIGEATTASEKTSFAGGSGSQALYGRTFAFGDSCIADRSNGVAFGEHTIARSYNQFVIGSFNVEKDDDHVYAAHSSLLIVGSGTEMGRSNCFRVTRGLGIYANAAYNASGADYAEYFEWLDGNRNNQDRVGYFVTLDGDKIKIAHQEDRFILGIISATPSVIGNSYDDQWEGRELKDEWGRIIYEEVESPEEKDEEGNVIEEAHREMQPKLNPDYDNTRPYLGRSQRSEWSAVGMLGQLLVRDDGTCQVNGYCRCADGGIATASKIGYRVLARVTENVIKILFR